MRWLDFILLGLIISLLILTNNFHKRISALENSLKNPPQKTISILVSHHDGKYKVTDVFDEKEAK